MQINSTPTIGVYVKINIMFSKDLILCFKESGQKLTSGSIRHPASSNSIFPDFKLSFSCWKASHTTFITMANLNYLKNSISIGLKIRCVQINTVFISYLRWIDRQTPLHMTFVFVQVPWQQHCWLNKLWVTCSKKIQKQGSLNVKYTNKMFNFSCKDGLSSIQDFNEQSIVRGAWVRRRQCLTWLWTIQVSFL